MKHWSEETKAGPLKAKADELKAAIELAVYECRDEDAEALHNDLVAVEWRLRRAS